MCGNTNTKKFPHVRQVAEVMNTGIVINPVLQQIYGTPLHEPVAKT